MSKYVTKVRLNKTLHVHADEIIGIVKDFMFKVSDKFDELNSRLDVLYKKYEKLMTNIDGFMGRIYKCET